MPSYDYNKFIVELLKTGAMLGSDITFALKEKFNKTESHCRKILNRAKDSKIVYDSYPLVFNNGQFGYSLESSRDNYKSLLKYKPRLYEAFMLMNRDLIVSKIKLLKITGTLNTIDTKYYDFGKLIKDLEFFGKLFVTQKYGTDFYSYISTLQISESDYEREYYERKMNVRVIPLVLSYCRKMNLISKRPIYSSTDDLFIGVYTRQNLVFDAIGYTNIGNPNQEKTICVFDVEISSDYTPAQYEGFMYRIETLKNSTHHFKQRVIPFLVVKKITPSFEKKLRLENKIIILELSNIFGSRINYFLDLLEYETKDKTNDLNSTILNVFEMLGKNDFANTLIRFIPFVFESLVNEVLGLLVSNSNKHISFIRKTISVNAASKQFDGYYEDDENLYLVESKFHKKNKIKWESYNSKGKIDNDCMKYFFIDKYEHARKYLESKNQVKNIRMCFVSANGFWKDVNEKITSVHQDINPIMNKLKLYNDVGEIIATAKSMNITVKEHEKWFDEYYIKHEQQSMADEFEEEYISFDAP